MNFLGHCYFSRTTSTALAGSLWPDFAKRPSGDISIEFLTHFDKHQAIDHFTDHCKELEPVRLALRPTYRKTTPLVIDMLIDHYLASQWSLYHDTPLNLFAQQCYRSLEAFDELPVPLRFEKTIYWMKKHDWFVSYQHPENIVRSLEGLATRLRFVTPLDEHAGSVVDHCQHYREEFSCYMQALSEHLR